MKRASSLVLILIVLLISGSLNAQTELPGYLGDRGAGVPLSMFGTYINKGEFIFYPFFEYYKDKDAEYSPQELGFGLDEDFRGRYEADEYLLFFGYGISEDLAVEFEAAYISATQHKASNDPSATPSVIKESGLGDVEGQLRWRFQRETQTRPEYFSYFETVLPLQKDKILIGTQDWEFKLGAGAVKGFTWGTTTFRLAVEYDAGDKEVALGEYALEYLRKLSDFFQYTLVIEGADDEIEFITDLQFHINPKTFIRINNAFGVTSKATDYAPEVGVVFRF